MSSKVTVERNQIRDRVVKQLDTPYDLDPARVTSFAENGWVHLPGLLNAEEAGEIYAGLKEFGDLEVGSDEKWLVTEEYQQVLRMQDGMAWEDQFFRNVAVSRRLSETALALMGLDEAKFILDMAFIKPAEKGKPTAFHQDWPYWPFDRQGALTIWIALVDLPAESGTLQFLSGSHRAGPLGQFNRVPGDDIRNAYPSLSDDFPVAAGKALKAGDATVHMDMTVHGSGPNETEHERAAYTARYLTPSARYTGSPHRHFDAMKMECGVEFGSVDAFPTVRRQG
ncbi:phytanoyl-CoA dioxygenase family protein [Saccharopolyspora spinosa]|uniref:Phytanoyl-CoA dioxygenase PhyH n=1 Tax=Saccharopolyspora spinosa TaxID=60894 RepID=A0A2N3Y1K7_SACSN|nr:phytanoyl-CoA dioxygenase family protein [Saccharopolyspora spinosa]PKW16770.1 phytanoyl-CoA dioxygenase PhyH [Saccharopolyspora spinosa]